LRDDGGDFFSDYADAAESLGHTADAGVSSACA
jgi:hypothetical protein